MLCTSTFSSAIGSFSIGFSPIDLEPHDGVPSSKTIKSYLYWQYQDDDDLNALVDAYNTMTQSYVDWFNALQLPVYTRLQGALLDWVAQGLYGITRPILGEGVQGFIGLYDTFLFDTIPLDTLFKVAFGGGLTPASKVLLPPFVGQVIFTLVDDDVYKRIITWHFYKGDSKYIATRWLKRRVARFLEGICGTAPDIDETYLISITYGVQQTNIRLLTHNTKITGGAFYDTFLFDEMPFDWINIAPYRIAERFVLADAFKAGIDDGVLEMPFQYSTNVQVRDLVGTSLVPLPVTKLSYRGMYGDSA